MNKIAIPYPIDQTSNFENIKIIEIQGSSGDDTTPTEIRLIMKKPELKGTIRIMYVGLNRIFYIGKD